MLSNFVEWRNCYFLSVVSRPPSAPERPGGHTADSGPPAGRWRSGAPAGPAARSSARRFAALSGPPVRPRANRSALVMGCSAGAASAASSSKVAPQRRRASSSTAGRHALHPQLALLAGAALAPLLARRCPGCRPASPGPWAGRPSGSCGCTKPAPSLSVRTISPRSCASRRRKASFSRSLNTAKPPRVTTVASTTWERVFLS